MAVTNNLYPPVVDTYMPAFLVEDSDGCKVYFSLSQYNVRGDIRDAQVTVVSLNTNLTVLSSEKYPSEIKLCEIQEDETRASDDKYYITITNDDLEEGFSIDVYYKVQIRFTSTDAETVSYLTPQQLDTWLAENLDYFSEWSSICLIKGIATPDLQVEGFSTSGGKISWSMVNTDLIGKLTFEDEDETETLKSYRIRLYRKTTDKLLTDSGILYTTEFTDVNSFVYTFKYAFEENASYYFTVDYTTNDLYSAQVTFNFTVGEATGEPTTTVTLVTDKDNGRIGIALKESPTGEEIEMTRRIMIRRTSSETSFTIWEDLYYQEFIAVPYVNSIWYDTTIESGVWYKYCIQDISESGARSSIKIIEDPVMIDFDDMFLTTADKQLKIQFNPSVSSYKKTLSEYKVDTLGSQYPFIRRSGYADYAQFPVSGLISGLMDDGQLFATSLDVYGDETNKELYHNYNEQEGIRVHNDFIYEKKFRKLVMDFLYDSKPKLFRSPTEGNVLVKIMDVSLNPDTTLSRMIWSFNGTAYEIADIEIDTLKEYNIINTQTSTIPTDIEEEYEDSIQG